MAYYDYVCQECQHQFTVKRSFADYEREQKDHEASCPQCGSRHIQRVIREVHVVTAKKS